MENYIVVTSSEIETLVEKVNLLINQGWITQGGIVYISDTKLYLQSMVASSTWQNPASEDESDDLEGSSEDEKTMKSEPLSREESIRATILEDSYNFSVTTFRYLYVDRHVRTVGDLLDLDISNITHEKIVNEINAACRYWILKIDPL